MRRSNLNFYDEAAFVGDEELFKASEPFCAQSSSFGLGVDISDEELKCEPHPFPNQLIYASSAGRTDQYFFTKYREASIHMDAGDKRYFCADINSDMILNATRHGVRLSQPLLTKETIEARMREDKEAGLREYGNIFTSEGGDNQIIRRATIIKNSYSMVPVLGCEEPGHYYGLAYDPARISDNSVIGIGEFYQSPNDGWHMKLVNMISLADTMKKKKTPMNTPNQVKILKQVISDYILPADTTYDYLISILVDAGTGGAGVPITDFICEDWVDKDGHPRRGLVDPEYNEGDKRRFPNAVSNKLKLLQPSKYKTEFFESLIKMVESGFIEFTEEYMNKGYLDLIYEIDNKKHTKKLRNAYPSEAEGKKLSANGIVIESEMYHLSLEEELALRQLDAAKTEVVNIYRFKQASGKDRFDLAPEKVGKMNDDRAYVVAMLGWQLAQLRRSSIVNRKSQNKDISQYFSIRAPKKIGNF